MIFMALVPVLNSSFYMFNIAYYARWYYMLILMMCLATVRCAESTTVSWRSAFKWVFGITAAAVLVIGFFPSEVTDGKIAKWGLYTNSDSIYFYRFLATSAIALISLVMLGLLLKMIKSSRKQFFAVSTALICIISAI